MHTEKERKEGTIGNTKTRELVLDASSADLSSDGLQELTETDSNDGQEGDGSSEESQTD